MDWRNHKLVCSLLAIFFVHGASQAAPVQPPGRTPGAASHRRLQLPDGGTADIHRQMQMLKQLQSMFGNEQDGQTAAPPVTPQQMEMIRQMMKSFSGQDPEELMKQIGNLPPDMLSGVAGDPNARRQIKDMLQQYARDRRIPR